MRQLISNIICWCGGANLAILAQCPEERGKFESLGTGIIMTALLSGLAMSFALFTLFTQEFQNRNWVLSGVIFFWIIIIFSIDWSLIKTMYKKREMKALDWIKYIAGILFRFMVAGAISFTVAKPLEVKLFQSRLETEVLLNRSHVFREQDKNMKEEVARDSSNLANQQARLDDVNGERLAGCQDPDFLALIVELGKLEKELNGLKNKNTSLRSENRALYNREDCIIRDTLGQRVGMELKCRTQYNRNNKRVNSLAREINSINQKISNREKEASDIKEQWTKSLLSRQENAENSADLALAEFENNQQQRIEQEEVQNVSLNFYQPNLMTYIEAIHSLEKKEEGKYIFYTRWLIFMVILLIDTAPIIIKLLIKRGSYEEIFDRIQYEQLVQQKQMKFLADRERIANERLIKDIDAIQGHLLREAMTQYYADEHKSMAMRYKDYFTIDQNDNAND